MQSFELLGGKYQQGEQILPGVVQTFRSYEVPTGRPVFIHRVASNDPAAQEIADLLSAGLIRSPTVRRMLVDVYDTELYRFVVTEPARQCVPLRDWLEHEADQAPEAVTQPARTPEPGLPISAAVKIPKPSREPEPLPEDEEEEQEEVQAARVAPPPDADSSEFARLFQEALSGKMERSRRNAAQNIGSMPTPPEPVVASAAAPVEEIPVTAPMPAPEAEPAMFSQAVEVEEAGRSTLVIFLVVLGVLIVLLVMFVVVFVKR